VRRALALVLTCVAAAVAAGSAGATNECRGLQVCVPVIGPWVVAPAGAQVSFQLACPPRFVVAGLDAELSRRGVDVTFRGMLGSPVNPGITTSTAAEFLGRLIATAPEATFRPHIGCVPAAGRGQRFPTAHRPVAPAPAVAPTVVQLTVTRGVHRYAARCPARKRLIGATHAVGFYTAAPPRASLIAKVRVAQTLRGGSLHVTVRAGALPVVVNAIVQVDLVCA
jgi:hypothetical protein